MKDLAGKLIAAGDQVSDCDLIMHVLGGLGSNLKPITTLLKPKPYQGTVDEIQFHLLAFEAKLDEENSTVTVKLHEKHFICLLALFLKIVINMWFNIHLLESHMGQQTLIIVIAAVLAYMVTIKHKIMVENDQIFFFFYRGRSRGFSSRYGGRSSKPTC